MSKKNSSWTENPKQTKNLSTSISNMSIVQTRRVEEIYVPLKRIKRLLYMVKCAHGVSQQFFFFNWTRAQNHYKYVEIKQFSKVDIKQSDIPTVILFIKFLFYQWDPRHLQGSRIVYICIYIMEFVFSQYLITFCVSIIRILFNLIICDVHKKLSS